MGERAGRPCFGCRYDFDSAVLCVLFRDVVYIGRGDRRHDDSDQHWRSFRRRERSTIFAVPGVVSIAGSLGESAGRADRGEQSRSRQVFSFARARSFSNDLSPRSEPVDKLSSIASSRRRNVSEQGPLAGKTPFSHWDVDGTGDYHPRTRAHCRCTWCSIWRDLQRVFGLLSRGRTRGSRVRLGPALGGPYWRGRSVHAIQSEHHWVDCARASHLRIPRDYFDGRGMFSES
jgi:hypothetical protein